MLLRAGAIAAGIVLVGCSPPAPAASRGPTNQPAAASFPVISDWSSLRIRLERGACHGFCPVYRVEIRGDGVVTYCGGDFVKERGARTKTIAPDSVRSLLDLFIKADFFDLRDDYLGGVDAPSQKLVLSFDGRTKQVGEILGESDGMPPIVKQIGQAIDAVSGATEWVGNEPTYIGAGQEACVN